MVGTGSTVRRDNQVEGPRLRVAVIGAGAIARSAHLPAWAVASGAQVDIVVDIDEANARAVASEYGIARWATDVSAVLDGTVDAVDICLPASSHFKVVKQCLEAGLHVLVEKPVTTTLREALLLRQVALRAPVVLMVAENWPFASASRRLAALLREDELGQVLSIRSHHETGLCLPDRQTQNWVRDPGPFGGGYMMNAGIHSISLVQSLVGELAEVQAFADTSERGSDHQVVAIGRSRKGVLVSFYFTGYSRHLGGRRLGLRVVASKGVAEIDLVSGTVEWTSGGQEHRLKEVAPSMGFREEIDHFIECVIEGREPQTGLVTQIGALASVHAIYQSVRESAIVKPSELLAQTEVSTDS